MKSERVLKFIFALLVSCVIVMLVALILKIIRINNNKWYVKITNDYINVRSEASTYSRIEGKVEKGETYKVLDINLEDDKYYWYYIEIDNFNKGWIASNRNYPYLEDFNNPHDITPPTVKYYDAVYYVNNINDINYNHLEITDNTDYSISHTVYYEEKENQYWITYKVIDSGKNETSKTQKIVFSIEPDHNEIEIFEEHRKETER